MALLDLLGRRWALRVIWELREGAPSFRALQERCDGVSPTVLSTRLAELREAGVLAPQAGEGYRLTRDGAALLAALAPLDGWAKGWARRS
jgi:DNA-binding HxlR family transcriptional regulator